MPLDWQGQWDDPNLNVVFKNDVQAMLGIDPGHWRVEKPAFRTAADQLANWQKGRDADGNVIDKDAVVTNAKPGQSPHEYGLAVDVCLCKPDYGVTGKETWDYTTDPDWQRMWTLCDAAPRLHSGYHFGDGDHLEGTRWGALRQQLIDEGKW